MRNGRFIRKYRRWRRRRFWRIRQIRQTAGKREVHLRRILLPVLAAEVFYGVCYFVTIRGYDVRLIRLEEEYQIEWHEKHIHEIYGIRFCPGQMEVEFYYREPMEMLPGSEN